MKINWRKLSRGEGAFMFGVSSLRQAEGRSWAFHFGRVFLIIFPKG